MPGSEFEISHTSIHCKETRLYSSPLYRSPRPNQQDSNNTIRWLFDGKGEDPILKFLSRWYYKDIPEIRNSTDSSATRSKRLLERSTRYAVIWPLGHGTVEVSRSISKLTKCFLKREEPTVSMPSVFLHENRWDNRYPIVVLKTVEEHEDCFSKESSPTHIGTHEVSNLKNLVEYRLPQSYRRSNIYFNEVNAWHRLPRSELPYAYGLGEKRWHRLLDEEKKWRQTLTENFWSMLKHCDAMDDWRRLKDDEKSAEQSMQLKQVAAKGRAMQEADTQKAQRCELTGDDGIDILYPDQELRTTGWYDLLPDLDIEFRPKKRDFLYANEVYTVDKLHISYYVKLWKVSIQGLFKKKIDDKASANARFYDDVDWGKSRGGRGKTTKQLSGQHLSIKMIVE